MPRTLYISAGHTAHSKYNTGIQRVTRSVARETLLANPCAELLEWNIERGRYITLDDNARKKLAKYNGPKFVKPETELGQLFWKVGKSGTDGAVANQGGVDVSHSLLDTIGAHLNSDVPVDLFEASLRRKREGQKGLELKWTGYLPLPRSARRGLRHAIRTCRDFGYRWLDKNEIRKVGKRIRTFRKAIWKDCLRAERFLDRWKVATSELNAAAAFEVAVLNQCIEEAKCLAEEIELRRRFHLIGLYGSRAPSLIFEQLQDIKDWHREDPESEDQGVRLVASESISDPIDYIKGNDFIRELEAVVDGYERFIHLPLRWTGWLPLPKEMRRVIRKRIREFVDSRIRAKDRNFIRKRIAKLIEARRSMDHHKGEVKKAYRGITGSLRALSLHMSNAVRVVYSCAEVGSGSGNADDSFSRLVAELDADLKQLQRLFERFEPVLNRFTPLKFKPQKGGWIVIPELMKQDEMEGAINFAKRNGAKIAVVFHDSIPLLYPEWVNDEILKNHEGYMSEMARADCILAVSEFSANCYRDFVAEKGLDEVRVEVCANGVSFAEGGRNLSLSSHDIGDKVRVMHIGTLEPRKNHKVLLEAWALFRDLYPNIDAELTLIGNPYDGFEDLENWVRDFAAGDSSISWLGGVDDATVNRHYDECDFTVFPSIVEGFGLPILESIWHGRPCITANFGAMSEVAEDGGCVTVDVRDAAALAEAIGKLASDRDLCADLRKQCIFRPLRSWRDYALEMHELLGVEVEDRAEAGSKGSSMPCQAI